MISITSDDFFITLYILENCNTYNKGLFDNLFCTTDGIDIVALELLLFYFTAK